MENARDEEICKLMAWRKKGPMGKLHNICTWITRTPQRQDRFQDRVAKSNLSPNDASVPIVGSITWWGGDYDSLVQAFLLRDAIEDFMISEIRSQKLGKTSYQKEKESQNYSIDNNELTVDDWEELREMKDILEPFRKWSLILQGK